MIHFQVQQGIKGLEMMLGHLRAQTEVGKMIQIGIAYVRLISGQSKCPFLYPSEFTAYFLKDWFMTTRAFLAETNSSIAFRTPAYLQSKCHGDICIMDHATPPAWKISEVKAINRCHLYLRVLYVSDITHGDGKTLISNGFHGLKPFNSLLQWPNQGRLSEHDWRIWQRFIRREFLRQDGSLHLRSQLGHWFEQETLHHRLWRKHLHGQGVCILRHEGWHLYKLITHGRHSGTVETTSTPCAPPSFCPVTFNPDTLTRCYFWPSTTTIPGDAPGQLLGLRPQVVHTALSHPVEASRLELAIDPASIRWKLTSGINRFQFAVSHSTDMYTGFLSLVLLVCPYLREGKTHLRILMDHSRYFHRYNKSVISL